MLNCPTCGIKIDASAIVDSFMSEPEWEFYGEKGKRWIVCNENRVVHFRVLDNGRSSHRIATCRD